MLHGELKESWHLEIHQGDVLREAVKNSSQGRGVIPLQRLSKHRCQHLLMQVPGNLGEVQSRRGDSGSAARSKGHSCNEVIPLVIDCWPILRLSDPRCKENVREEPWPSSGCQEWTGLQELERCTQAYECHVCMLGGRAPSLNYSTKAACTLPVTTKADHAPEYGTSHAGSKEQGKRDQQGRQRQRKPQPGGAAAPRQVEPLFDAQPSLKHALLGGCSPNWKSFFWVSWEWCTIFGDNIRAPEFWKYLGVSLESMMKHTGTHTHGTETLLVYVSVCM